MEFDAPHILIDEEFSIRIPEETEAYQLSRLIDLNRERLKLWLPWLDLSRSVQDSERYIKKCRVEWALHGHYTGLIYRGAEITGAIGFHPKVHRGLAIGYWIADKYTARGLCTRACQAMIDWSFQQDAQLHLVELRAATENRPSRRVAEKLGLQFEGILRDREWLYDRFVSHAIYSTTREEWHKLRYSL